MHKRYGKWILDDKVMSSSIYAASNDSIGFFVVFWTGAVPDEKPIKNENDSLVFLINIMHDLDKCKYDIFLYTGKDGDSGTGVGKGIEIEAGFTFAEQQDVIEFNDNFGNKHVLKRIKI